jgi:hypothetical protein
MEDLKKGWKENLAAALMAAAPVSVDNQLAPEKKQAQGQEVVKKVPTHHDYDVPFGKHHLDSFLHSISFLESSGGKFTEHAAGGGIHEQDRAIGSKGLMPKTVKNIGGMLKNPKSALRSVLGEHYHDREFSQLAELPEDKISEKLKQNPKLYLRGARYLAEHLRAMHNGDRLRMAFGWRFGHNRPSDSIKDHHIEGSGYVKKFREHFMAHNPNLRLRPASEDSK